MSLPPLPDPAALERLAAALEPLRSISRPVFVGDERVPKEGPLLLVGNHSGGNVPPDTFVFTLAFCSYFGVERPFYQLVHNLVALYPALWWLPKFGTVAASPDNASPAASPAANPAPEAAQRASA